MKKFDRFCKLLFLVFVFIGALFFCSFMKNMIPDMQKNNKINSYNKKTHTEELNTNINEQNEYANYDGVKIKILTHQIINNQFIADIEVDTTSFKDPVDLTSEVVSKKQPMGNLSCYGLSLNIQDNKMKKRLVNEDEDLETTFQNNCIYGFIDNDKQKPGYLYSVSLTPNNVVTHESEFYYYSKTHYKLIVRNPKINLLRFSIDYNYNLAQFKTTNNYVIIK